MPATVARRKQRLPPQLASSPSGRLCAVSRGCASRGDNGPGCLLQNHEETRQSFDRIVAATRTPPRWSIPWGYPLNASVTKALKATASIVDVSVYGHRTVSAASVISTFCAATGAPSCGINAQLNAAGAGCDCVPQWTTEGGETTDVGGADCLTMIAFLPASAAIGKGVPLPVNNSSVLSRETGIVVSLAAAAVLCVAIVLVRRHERRRQRELVVARESSSGLGLAHEPQPQPPRQQQPSLRSNPDTPASAIS